MTSAPYGVHSNVGLKEEAPQKRFHERPAARIILRMHGMGYKLGVLSTTLAIGMFAASALTLPTIALNLGTLTFATSGKALLALVILCLTFAGVEDIVRSHPTAGPHQLQRSYMCWILPVLLVAVAMLVLAAPATLESRVRVILLGLACLSGLILLEYSVLDTNASWQPLMARAVPFAAHALAVPMYAVLSMRMGGGIGGIGTAAASAALALRLIVDPERSPVRVAPYALAIGALLGVSFDLLSGVVAPMPYALAMTVLLYIATGVTNRWLLGTLTRRVIVEYLIAGVVILLLLYVYGV